MSRYPWRDTSTDIAGGQPPQWETPQGAQAKADKALKESKEYTDQQNVDFSAHIANTTIHVTPADKVNWNSKAPGVHTHANATPTVSGFMSAEDKAKLNNVEAEANKYVHPITHPPAIIAQDSSNRFVTDAEKVAWNWKADTTEATTSTKGLMSAGDKQKLNGIQTGAEVNQNAFAVINGVAANDPSDMITLVEGVGIRVSTNPVTKELTITATGNAAPGAHGSTHTEYGADPIPSATATEGGLMSAADKSLQLAHSQELENQAAELTGLSDRLDTPDRTDITLQPGISVINANQDAAFRLAGLQGRTALNYQSQIGIFGVLNPYVIRYGDNLLPPFYEWSQLGTDAKIVSSYELSVNTTNTGGSYSYVNVPCLPNTDYYLSVDIIGTHVAVETFDAVGTSIFTRYLNNGIVTTEGNAQSIRVTIYRVDAGDLNAKEPMLTIGNVAKPFVPREDAMLALQTELHANPDTGANPDMVFESDGQYFKVSKWSRIFKIGVDALTTDDYNLSIPGNMAAGFKRVRVRGFPKAPYDQVEYTSYLTKYDGSVIEFRSDWSKTIEQHSVSNNSGNYALIGVNNTDSGWGDAYTPTADEIKAYFMGWKMYDVTVSSSGQGVYNGSGAANKRWAYRADGISATYAGGTTTLPTTVAPNYTPYQLQYQLATPVVEPITSEGQLTFIDGDNQVEVGTGIVLREYTPAPENTNPNLNGRREINFTQVSSSLLKNKASDIIAIYKNSKRDYAWSIGRNVSDSYGLSRANLVKESYDPAATYSVTYLMMVKYPSVDITGTYAENEKALLLDTVKTLQENTTRISVLESKKAEKDAPSQMWITPTLLNGWVDYGTGSYGNARYYKDSAGRVYFDGLIKSGIVGSSGIAFKLPKGFIPSKTFITLVQCSDGTSQTYGRVDVKNNGDVVIATGANGWLSLADISFLAEA
ncbi:hypothetical protein ASD24_26750 [Paenibacillus sp. Root52]|uniref:hypothetical protein n=1 Tax=Paenibacillus sp. Root52 TaxID=1736552 RepID=UPI0006FEE37F|nr:hypothetical protein [Paenibacillus sp. Root52]KQY87078.1 hypothetical protein ASD24_26750 [Paenibacillus sp. Root52]